MDKKDKFAIEKIKLANETIIKNAGSRYNFATDIDYIKNYTICAYDYIAQRGYYDAEQLEYFDNVISKNKTFDEREKIFDNMFSLKKCILKNKGICGSFSRYLILLLANNESGLKKYYEKFAVSEVQINFKDDQEQHCANFIEYVNNNKIESYYMDVTFGLYSNNVDTNKFVMMSENEYLDIMKDENKKIESMEYLTYRPNFIKDLYKSLNETEYFIPDSENEIFDGEKYFSRIKNFGDKKL